MDPEPRCFQLNEEAELAMLQGDYRRAADLFDEGALCAFTREGAHVLLAKADHARVLAQTQRRSA